MANFLAPTQQTTAPILPTLLLPLQATTLIVPNVSMAELIAYQLPQRPQPGLPGWIQGHITWRGETIPLILFESYLGRPRGADSNQLRIAVMNSLTDSYPGQFFALLLQGIPRILKAQESDLSYTVGADRDDIVVAMETPMGKAMLPNFERLEADLGKALAG